LNISNDFKIVFVTKSFVSSNVTEIKSEWAFYELVVKNALASFLDIRKFGYHQLK